ncbi:hypothetical protein GCM10007421_03490 [Halopseudomonas oceani]|nr:hypothetical protein GCM10007421_03490 [Halopseudomonas oceani]
MIPVEPEPASTGVGIEIDGQRESARTGAAVAFRFPARPNAVEHNNEQQVA